MQWYRQNAAQIAITKAVSSDDQLTPYFQPEKF